ncbi:MAG: hypothetical protein GC191_17840 [Azospirillum sp.]|nr:hypothetical protein [Azospirillum sp.]
MDPDKFAKVLAMAESDHQGEAQSALRAARIMLSRAGLTFRDLAGLIRHPPVCELPRPEPTLVERLGQRRQIEELENQIGELVRKIERQRCEIDKQRQEADRWRKLARETAEQLWDLGKTVERRATRPTTEQRRKAILEHLRDPATAQWSDREIARRVGTSPVTVAHWRRQLSIDARRSHANALSPRERREQPGHGPNGSSPRSSKAP